MQETVMASVNIERVKNGERSTDKDLLAVEEPLEIRLEYGRSHERVSKSISVTMRTPGRDAELALGFLFTEGIIQHREQIIRVSGGSNMEANESSQNVVQVHLKDDVGVDIDKLKRNFYTSSSCGVCGKESINSLRVQCSAVSAHDVLVAPEVLLTLPSLLLNNQIAFEHTGGIHASALFDLHGQLLLVREDVGRHNALDKLIGAARFYANNHLDCSKTILLLSGRASFELLQKAAMAGIPLVCAVGAPSSLAVQSAKEFGITLIGFLRDERFNIYSGAARVKNGINENSH